MTPEERLAALEYIQTRFVTALRAGNFVDQDALNAVKTAVETEAVLHTIRMAMPSTSRTNAGGSRRLGAGTAPPPEDLPGVGSG